MSVIQDTQAFARSIDAIHAYFTGVGVAGKKPNQLITSDLKLVAKPKVLQVARKLEGVLWKTGLFRPKKSHLSSIVVTIEIFVSMHQTLDETTKQKAKFVTAVLRTIRSKQDHRFRALSLINRFRYELAFLRPVDRPPSDLLLLQRQENGYLAEKMPNKKELTARIKALAPIPKLGNFFSAELIEPILQHLSVREVVRASKTCRAWQNGAKSRQLWRHLSRSDALFFLGIPLHPDSHPLEVLRLYRRRFTLCC